jgi:FtsZ-interacting cell division protein ZipA
MISLQIAFLIAGVVVFFIILVISYDKIRHARLHSRDDSGADHEEPEPLLKPRATAGVDIPRPAPRSRDDSSPETDTETDPEPQLKPEFLDQERVSEPPRRTEDWETLKSAEELANTPIDGVPEMSADAGEESLQIEYVARIPGKNVIKRDSALGIYRQHEFDMSKPHRIFGLSHPTRMWCDLEKQPDSARFTDFGLTLQLADRDGPATESDLNRFSQVVLKLAEVFGRKFQFSCDLDDALNQADHLDKTIKKYDALAILNIVARDDSFKLSDLDAVAHQLGMVPNQKSVYVKYENRRPVYRMADKEKTRDATAASDPERTTRGVTLFMDIPRTQDPARVFNDMVDDAMEICKQLDGKLVDDNHRGMTQKGLKRIAQEIRTMAAEMDQDGIAPGSDFALKLF